MRITCILLSCLAVILNYIGTEGASNDERSVRRRTNPADPTEYDFLQLGLPSSSAQDRAALAGPVTSRARLMRQQSMPNAPYAAGASRSRRTQEQGQDPLALTLHPASYTSALSFFARSSSLPGPFSSAHPYLPVPSIRNRQTEFHIPEGTQVLAILSDDNGAGGYISLSKLPKDYHPKWITEKKADGFYAVYVLTQSRASWIGKPKYTVLKKKNNQSPDTEFSLAVPVPQLVSVYIKLPEQPQLRSLLEPSTGIPDNLSHILQNDKILIFFKNTDGDVKQAIIEIPPAVSIDHLQGNRRNP